jgi:hypothetical protein
MAWLNYHHLLYFWLAAKEGSVTAGRARARVGSGVAARAASGGVGGLLGMGPAAFLEAAEIANTVALSRAGRACPTPPPRSVSP